MKKKIVTVVSLILAIAMVFSVASCGGGAETPAPPEGTVHPDYLRISAGEPATLDPAKVSDIGSHAFVANIFSGLLKLEPVLLDKKTGEVVAQGRAVYTEENKVRFQRGEVVNGLAVVVPDIAEALPEPIYNRDGTISYIFKIRKGIKFHSGSQREVTAYDFAYSLDRAADPRTMSTTAELYLGDILGVIEMLFAEQGWLYQGKKLINRVSQDFTDISKVLVDLPGVEVLDTYTLKITTKNILPSLFYQKMTYPTAFVVDKFQVENAVTWTKRPNGTGPYRVTKKEPAEIVLEASDVYYDGIPAIKKVVYYLGGASSFMAYRANERDISGVDLDYIETARDPNSEWYSQYFEDIEMSTTYIGFNLKEKPFDDIKVRQAFAMAVDKTTLVHYILKDMALEARGILPPGMPGYREGLQGLPFDPERARQLLAESTYGGPEGLGIIKIATSSGAGGSPSEVLQAIIQMWKENLGVEVLYDNRDWARFLEDLSKGDFQMFSMGWIADYPDPEDFLDLKFHSSRSMANNTSQYANPRVDELLEMARIEKDPERRIKLYQETEDIIIQEVPWLVLFHGKDNILVKPYIANYVPTRMGISSLRYLRFTD